MKRLAAAVCAGVTALAVLTLAAPAGAAISPKFTVTPVTSGGANLIISAGSSNPSEDAFAKVQIFMPTGYALKSPVGGATVGTVSAHATAKDIDPTQETNWSGKIVAIGLTDPAIAYENQNCDNTTHSAAWSVQLLGSSSGQVSFPIFIDKTSGSEAAFGPYKLTMCLRSPDLTQADPNRSSLGFKLNNFVLTLSGFTHPKKAADYRWRALWTPYTPGSATVNTAGSVETQSIVRVPPGALALVAKRSTTKVGNQIRKIVTLSGSVLVAGEPAGGYKVGFSHGTAKTKLSRFGSATTKNDGTFVFTSRVTKPTWFQAGVTVPKQELGSAGCTPSFGTGVSCLNASISGARVLSQFIKVNP